MILLFLFRASSKSIFNTQTFIMKKLIFLFLLSSFTLSIAQTNKPTTESSEPLSEQFKALYKKSSTYKEYKVVLIAKYNALKNNVIDSIDAQKKLVKEKDITIQQNNSELKKLKLQLSDLQQQLQESIIEKNKRSIFGMAVEKSVFSFIIILTYLILILLTVFFAYQFKQNISSTKKAIRDLKGLEQEFEQHKKTSLKRFQEVNRKLQDELNKNWKKEK